MAEVTDLTTPEGWEAQEGFTGLAATWAAQVTRDGWGCIPPDDGALVAAAGPPQVDTATGEPHSEAMVALVPARPEAWVLDGWEPPDALHLTLAYLGEAEDMHPPVHAALLDSLEQMAATTPPLEANVFGAAVWNATGDTPSLVLSVGGAGLDSIHDAAWLSIGRSSVADPTAPWTPPANHQPWVAHVCLAYGPAEELHRLLPQAQRLEGPITFDRIRVAHDGAAEDFTLTGSVPEEDPMGLREDAAALGRLAGQLASSGLYDAAPVNPTGEPSATGKPKEEDDRPPSRPGEHAIALMHVQGKSTGLRTFTNLSMRSAPFAYHWQLRSAAHGGTPQTSHVGNVVRTLEDGNNLWGFITLDLGSDDGAEYGRRLVNGTERWVSIGLDETRATTTIVWPEMEEGEEPDPMAMEPEQVLIDGGKVGELTGVSVPAQADAEVYPTQELVDLLGGGEEPQEEPAMVAASTRNVRPRLVAGPAFTGNDDCGCGGSCGGCGTTPADMVEALTAAAWRIELPELPPAEWFREPRGLPMEGAFNLNEEGRVWGILAPLGTGHRAYVRNGGYGRREAPFGNVDYSRFMGAWASTRSGKVPAGPLTMDCGHAPIERASHEQAPAHYDNACSVIGAVAVGESRELGGVWMAGALLPGVKPEQIARALACRASGDWQPHPDDPARSELVACLLVPSPGFGTAHQPAASTTYRGEALVASSVPVRYTPTGPDLAALRRAALIKAAADGTIGTPAARLARLLGS